jgi:benzoyl-CoA reductase/2-hydroxyglutaryl-CoA dehydratase subunit BcrC/BadD/HgdB
MAAYTANLALQKDPVVGWCCSYVPVEVLETGGLVPLRLLPLPSAEMGDAYLNPNFCPYVRAILGDGLAGAYPFLAGLVIVNTCDGMRRLFDAWSHFHDPTFVHLMDLPRTTSARATGYFRNEIQHLVDRVSAHFGVSITAENLKVCLEASNKTRRLFGQAHRLMRQGRLNLTDSEGAELFRARGILSRVTYDTLLERVIRESDGEAKSKGIPILLTGSMLENPEVLSMVEACGGNVVAQDLCVTGREPEDPISLTEDPLMDLARHYLLRPPCARMQETQRRIQYILNLVQSCGARGVIYYVLKFCDTFLYEIPLLRQRLKPLGIPVLTLESEYRRGGGIQTRIQAFLEMLHGVE